MKLGFKKRSCAIYMRIYIIYAFLIYSFVDSFSNYVTLTVLIKKNIFEIDIILLRERFNYFLYYENTK